MSRCIKFCLVVSCFVMICHVFSVVSSLSKGAKRRKTDQNGLKRSKMEEKRATRAKIAKMSNRSKHKLFGTKGVLERQWFQRSYLEPFKTIIGCYLEPYGIISSHTELYGINVLRAP